MPKRALYNQQPITIEDFRGLYARGDETNVPEDYLIECQNCKFRPSEIRSREGSVVSYNHGRTVLRFFFRESEDHGNVLLYLDSVGNLYGVRMGVRTLLHTQPAATDFSITDTLNRIFITFHDGIQGIPGEYVYWWDGTDFARVAASAPTAASPIVAVDGATGNVDVGNHVIAVAYETKWGFITQPGPYIMGTYVSTLYVAPGSLKIDLSIIPIGPAGTYARHILMSRANLPALYFVPGGRIGDNTTTTFTINSFDSDLIESADFLFNLRTTVAAGVKLFKYAGRLGVLGMPAPDNSLVRLSYNDGDFESFDDTTGFLLANQDDRRKNKNAFEFRSNLYIVKTQGVFATSDTGEEPVNWGTPITVDASVGAEVNGVCEMSDVTTGNTKERVLVADESGLLLFDGVFQEHDLTWAVRDVWDAINKSNFHKVQVLNDPTNRFIYLNIPLNSSTPDYVLFGDYNLGLTPDKIRWSIWKFDNDLPRTISVMDLDGNGPVFRYGMVNNVYRLCPNTLSDNGTPIDAFFKEWLMSIDPKSGSIFQYNTLQTFIEGSGTMDVTLEGLNKVVIEVAPVQTLLSVPGRNMVMKFNFKNERVAPKFRVNELDEWFQMNAIYLNGVYYGAARPA